ncbi:hypothetical protein RHSIM_Rhsim08G0051400 [Rhododendron simsii]|uniref:Zinc finger CCCH domain-containing protein 41 n=1 Tax=Rhododendron simsii TaxID=118357 RepID=A0A834LGY5_RHOSS|nr:hypothetical protein RHSIM_Rhsim08G0051400 [Rhododendron simsii]
MELKVSSPKDGRLSPSDCLSDPEEKEITDDEDDDRNHKHRRRETRSQSMERDSMEQVLTRPYRKRNKPFENGLLYRENHSQSNETWKSYNTSPLEKDLSTKFEKRRPGFSTFSRAPNRVNQSSSAEPGSGRGRGRESGFWGPRDPRFSNVDIASQMVSQGSSLFAGRGLPNVSNSQGGSWNAFGLIPGIPNGGMDTLHSLGLQGALGPSISPLNIGLPRQRCRDFEERGFCLRGDMCPMEHGVNRIVIEDVQSLSQFNLPVSLPSTHLVGTPSALPSVNAPSSTLIHGKSLHNKSSKHGMADDGFSMNGVFTGSAGGADFYDPDQPLWANNGPENSTALLGLNSSKVDESESLLDGPDNEYLGRSTATAAGSLNASSNVWGRIGAKTKLGMKKKIDSTMSSSNTMENDAKEGQESLTNLQGPTRQEKRIVAEDVGSQASDSSAKVQGDTGRIMRKPSQKALRTLFVNGIPQKDNRRESLFSHFRKFGDVIDIYIPVNSERAFVQFSKREEAEAALKAPDAVMGNRFIKLWWANRDSILDDGTSSGNNVSVAPRGVAAVSLPPHLFVSHGGKDSLQLSAPKVGVSNVSVAAVLPASDHPKPVMTSSPKAPPPLQKKQESLEVLKEELRKKQELLDQKRNDFRRQLHKLERQTSGVRGDVPSEHGAKRHKPATVADVGKVATPRSAESGTVASPLAEVMSERNKSAENVDQQSSKQSTFVAPQEPSSLKHSIRPLAPAGASFVMNRFKLDNRPTAFKIIPPLPIGLANVAVLKEHFSAYGEISAVEIEDVESSDSLASQNCSAHISFTTRPSAERAFLNGRCWQGHNLQFTWVVSSNSSNGNGVRENSPSASKMPSDANLQPAVEVTPIDYHNEAASKDGESKVLDRKESGGEHMVSDEHLQSSSSAISCEKQSPKGDVC